MSQRDHAPVVIEEFGGLWDRGDPESCPLDHFLQADNIQFLYSGFRTRQPMVRYQTFGALDKIVRIYTYLIQTGHSFLVLREGGDIYHVKSHNEVLGPILSIPEMQDFGFVAVAGRAYITPFKTFSVGVTGVNVERGLPDSFLYVYKGDGTPARKAGGTPPINGGQKAFQVFNSLVDGKVTQGIHVFGFAFDNGLVGPEIGPVIYAPGDKEVQFAKLPLGPAGTASRTIVMTKAIDPAIYKPGWPPSAPSYEALVINDNTTVDTKINKSDEELTKEYVVGTTPGPIGGMQVINVNQPGHCDYGFHLVGVVFETDTGHMTAPGPEHFAGNTYIDIRMAVKVFNIPGPSDVHVVKRHLVSTKWIPEYNGDQKGYQFFFIPGGTLPNLIDAEMIVSYYDADLVADASHLSDNLSEIRAGVALTTYHSRLVLVGQNADQSLARISYAGEPEAFSAVDGIVIAPLDGNALTNCQEFRDVLYLYKKNRTYSVADNNDEPTTWTVEVVDESIGCGVHGIAAVLDSGGVGVDFLIVASYSGLILFNGIYAIPALSWKIENLWKSLMRNDFRYLEVVNNTIDKKIFITLPPPVRNHVLFADYSNGLDPKQIRWARWIFNTKISTLDMFETNRMVLGSIDALNPPIPPLHYASSGIFILAPTPEEGEIPYGVPDNRTTVATPAPSLIPGYRHDVYYGADVAIYQQAIPSPTVRTALIGD